METEVTQAEGVIRSTLNKLQLGGREVRQHYAELALERLNAAELSAARRHYGLHRRATNFEIAARALDAIDGF